MRGEGKVEEGEVKERTRGEEGESRERGEGEGRAGDTLVVRKL